MLLYDSSVSGNCYKVRLLFAHLGLEYERKEVSVVDRSDRAEVLGGLNPGLRVPTLVLDDGRALAESDAILFYFADGTRYLPDDRFERAKVLQWMFFEQYSHEPHIAVARRRNIVASIMTPGQGGQAAPAPPHRGLASIMTPQAAAEPTRPAAASAQESGEAALQGGDAALKAMEGHLTDRQFFVGERYSIADIALYAYTHVAPEGGFSLEPYPAIRAWLERVAAQPGHVPITD